MAGEPGFFQMHPFAITFVLKLRYGIIKPTRQKGR